MLMHVLGARHWGKSGQFLARHKHMHIKGRYSFPISYSGLTICFNNTRLWRWWHAWHAWHACGRGATLVPRYRDHGLMPKIKYVRNEALRRDLPPLDGQVRYTRYSDHHAACECVTSSLEASLLYYVSRVWNIWISKASTRV